MAFSAFESDRLRFRPISPADEAAIFRLRSDGRVGEALDRPLAKDRAEALVFIQKIIDGTRNGASFYWLLESKSGDEKAPLIGTICLYNFSADRRSAEIGYEISPNFWRQGFASEAVARVVGLALGPMGFEKVEAFTRVGNLPSSRLLEKMGFLRDAAFDDESDYAAFYIDRTMERPF